MRWTLVTGAAKRLGAHLARTLARSGKNIVIHYHKSENEAKSLQRELEQMQVAAEIISGDFSTIDSTQKFLEEYLARFAQTEIIINNVGNYPLGAPSHISARNLSELLQINTIAPLMLSQALLPSLKECRGSIVNIGMVGAHNVQANLHATAYHLTKVSLALLTKSLAKEWAPFGVQVNMVSPGYLENSIELPKEMTQVPAGRLAHLEDVAKAVCFFTAENNTYITGQILEVAGGTKL